MSGDDQSVHSAASSLSSAQTKIDCPHCKKEFQFRSMFNHLYNKHYTEFVNSLNRDWLNQAEEDSPLLFWWYYKDDFDEEKQVKLYGCLATKKTFTSEHRALLHFKKSLDSKKTHNKELLKLKKQAKKNKAENVQSSTDNPFKKALNAQDPHLARAFYSRYLYQLPLCKTAVESLSNTYQDSSEFKTGRGEHKTTLRKVKDTMTYLEITLQTFITEKDLDPKHLYSLFYKFEEIINVARYYTDYGHHYCYRSPENDRGMMQPTDEFYVGNPDYPQVDF
jgi:hypothetical protein